jgi:hypothetical protein
MRCLTVKQPWATLLVRGATRYLVSSWRTFYRGRLAIHASIKFPRSHVELCCDPDMSHILRRHGYDFVCQLPLQAAVGIVTVADCLPITEANRATLDSEDPVVFFGLAQPEHWVWICTDPQPFPQPLPLAGRLGLFNVPDTLASGSPLND